MNQPDVATLAHRLTEAWSDAWNAHDVPAAAVLVTPDVDFVTVAGLWLRGRAEFVRHHEDIHRRHLRASSWATHGCEARWLRADLALLHVQWTITGEQDVEGALRAPRSGVFTWVIDCGSESPLIVAAHNTNLRAGVTPRLAR